MVNVLAVCGAGMGTSMIIKMKVQQYFDQKGVDATVDSCSMDEADGEMSGYDVIICSVHLADEIKLPAGKTLISLTNMMDANEYDEKLSKISE